MWGAADLVASLKRERHVGSEPEPMIVVVGPTASGKTSLAIHLAEALSGEIISADSVQIYRRFDIGSGKPTAEERARAVHHLVDAVAPDAPVDAARFAEMATLALEDIRARGKRPILCGGTFLWVRALLHGLAPAPPADPALRERHRILVEAEGRETLHRLLAEVDPTSAARLHPRDFVRVSRALEVHELTGVPMSRWQEDHGFRERRHDARLVGVSRSPEELTARIAARVDGWLAGGWIDEVRTLLGEGLGHTRAMGSVGYREVHAHVEGSLSREDLAPAIVRATRVFARRQRTWLGHEDVRWLDGGGSSP